MGRALAALIAFASLLAAGCGEDDPDAPSGGTITYSRSGGIAGIGELLEISETGEAKLTLGYGPDARVERFEVAPGELEELQAHLEEVDFDAIDEGTSNTCADCFVYELSFGNESASSDSVTIVEAFSEAAAPLARLVERTVPPENLAMHQTLVPDRWSSFSE